MKKMEIERKLSFKRVVAGILVSVMVLSSMAGCGAKKDEWGMYNALNAGQDIELNYESSYLEADEHVGGKYPTESLDQVKTYPSFREQFDRLFFVNKVQINGVDTKSGSMFVGVNGEQVGNSTYENAVRNEAFNSRAFEAWKELSELSDGLYKDLKDMETMEGYDIVKVNAAINAYFGLFGEEMKGGTVVFDSDTAVSRADFYSFMARATQPVKRVEENKDFTAQVGENELNIYAQQMEKYGWLNLENKGLRDGNYLEPITYGEAVYMIANYLYDGAKADVKLRGVKNGGDMMNAGGQKLEKDGVPAKGYQLGLLAKMLEEDKNKVDERFYGIIANISGSIYADNIFDGEDLDRTITKYEAIQLFSDLVGHKAETDRSYKVSSNAYGKYEGNVMTDGRLIKLSPSVAEWLRGNGVTDSEMEDIAGYIASGKDPVKVLADVAYLEVSSADLVDVKWFEPVQREVIEDNGPVGSDIARYAPKKELKYGTKEWDAFYGGDSSGDSEYKTYGELQSEREYQEFLRLSAKWTPEQWEVYNMGDNPEEYKTVKEALAASRAIIDSGVLNGYAPNSQLRIQGGGTQGAVNTTEDVSLYE